MKKIDLDRVAKVQGVLSGKISNIELDPGTEPHVEPNPNKWLYYFKTRWLFISNIMKMPVNEFISESEAKATMEKLPPDQLDVFFCYLTGTDSKLPGPLENREAVKILQVNDSQALGNAIFMETGVRVDPATLDKVDFRTLAKRAIAFVSDRKKTDEIVSRLRANMRKNIR